MSQAIDLSVQCSRPTGSSLAIDGKIRILESSATGEKPLTKSPQGEQQTRETDGRDSYEEYKFRDHST